MNRRLTYATDIGEALLTANDFQCSLNNFIHGFHLSDYWINEKITQVMIFVHNLCYFTKHNLGYIFAV